MLMASDTADLEECWAYLRPSYIRSEWKEPKKEDVQEWALGRKSRLAAISGPTTTHRMRVYNWLIPLPVLVVQSGRWVDNGVYPSILPKSGVWSQLQALVHSEAPLIVDEPLQSIVDHEGPYASLLQAILDLRIQLLSDIPTDPGIRRIVHWMTESQPQEGLPPLRVQQQLELFFFLLALATQNECLRQQVVFILDGAENIVWLSNKQQTSRFQALKKVAELADQWAQLGCPVGILVGFSEQPKFKELDVCKWLQDRGING